MEAKGGTKAIGKKARGDEKGQDGNGRRKKRKVRDDRMGKRKKREILVGMSLAEKEQYER